MWRLTVSDGPRPDGEPRRRHLTFHGDEAAAAERLADLAETTRGPTRLGDLRVRELVDRYLFWLGHDDPDADALRSLADRVIEPTIGREFAALLDADAVEAGLRTAAGAGVRAPELRAARQLLADAYSWARRRRWTTRALVLDVES